MEKIENYIQERNGRKCISLMSNQREVFPLKYHSEFSGELDSIWVPITYQLPYQVIPRKACLSGIIKTAEDILRIMHKGEELIQRPHQK